MDTPNPRRSRKKKTPSKKAVLTKKRYFILGFAAIVLILILSAYAYINRLLRSNPEIPPVNMAEMTNSNLDESTLEILRENWTIAVFGLESENNTLGKGARSDTIMLCNINEKTGDIRLVSVFRDTYLKVGSSAYFKINSAYERGGPQQAIEALNENLDLQIDDYIAVTWKAVADGINAIGGIDLEVTKSEFKYLNAFITHTVESTGVPSVHLKQAGPNHLDGVQAVAYCRLRLMDTDFKRTERQQKVIQLALEKAKSSDLPTLNNAINIVLPQTAHDFKAEDIFRAAKNVSKYHLAKTGGFPFDLTTQYIGKADCVIAQDLTANVSKLHEFLFDVKDYQPSKKVQEINDKIQADSKKGKTPAETAAPAAESEASDESTAPEASDNITENTDISMEASESAETSGESAESTENSESAEGSDAGETSGSTETSESTEASENTETSGVLSSDGPGNDQTPAPEHESSAENPENPGPGQEIGPHLEADMNQAAQPSDSPAP